jgi:hypothetical protein
MDMNKMKEQAKVTAGVIWLGQVIGWLCWFLFILR